MVIGGGAGYRIESTSDSKSESRSKVFCPRLLRLQSIHRQAKIKKIPKTAPPVMIPIFAPDESDTGVPALVLVPLLPFVQPL